MKTTLLMMSAWGTLLAATATAAIEAGPFGPNGQGGSRNGQTLRLGPAGVVFELDAFLAVGGLDLNGADPGRAAKLSRHELPAGLTVTFTNELSADQTDLLLRYTLANTTNAPFNDLRFQVLVDAEIAETENTFFNDQAAVSGTAGFGPSDGAPDSWQIDEPGFAGGTLYKNLLAASLSNRHALDGSPGEDVAFGLGFSLGTLKPGETASVRVLLSEDGSTLGPLSLSQTDPATPATRVTVSGETDPRAPLVSDLTSLVRLSFEWRLNQPAGSLLGRLRIENLAGGQIALDAPFQLGLQSTASRYFVRPSGTLDNGVPYLDITGAMTAQLGGAPLAPGQAVTIDGVEIYSAGRLAPPANVWSFWGARLAPPAAGN